MEQTNIYFTEEKWEQLQKDVSDIKNLLSQLLIKYENSVSHEIAEILTAKQAAYLLGIDLPTIYARCANNMLPHFKVGKQYRFNRHEIMEWKEKIR